MESKGRETEGEGGKQEKILGIEVQPQITRCAGQKGKKGRQKNSDDPKRGEGAKSESNGKYEQSTNDLSHLVIVDLGVGWEMNPPYPLDHIRFRTSRAQKQMTAAWRPALSNVYPSPGRA
jgi:hypothetical protein